MVEIARDCAEFLKINTLDRHQGYAIFYFPGKTCGDPAYIARKGLFVLR